MNESVTFYYILAFVGLASMCAVAILYFVQKRGRIRKPHVEFYPRKQNPIARKVNMKNELDIRNALALHRDDQPVFLKVAEDMLTRIRSKSEIKVLEQIVREYKVTAELIDQKRVLIETMEACRDADHSYETQPIRQQRAEEIKALTHERDIVKLKSETKLLKNPPPPPKEKPALTTSEIARLKREEYERQLEDSRLVLEHEVKFRRMKDDIVGGYDEEQSKKHARQLDRIKNDLAERRADIQADPTLSPLEKENHLRALQKEYMRQLDDFEAKL